MEVVSCSAVACSSRNNNATFKPKLAAVAAVAPPHTAARGFYQCDQLLLLVLMQLATLVLVECEGGTIIGKVLVFYADPPPCATPPTSGAARRVGGCASSPTKVVVRETEVR